MKRMIGIIFSFFLIKMEQDGNKVVLHVSEDDLDEIDTIVELELGS